MTRALARLFVRAAVSAVTLAVLPSLGCSSDTSGAGAGEPFRVTAPSSARFIAGDLPGLPPLDTAATAETTPDGGAAVDTAPSIVDFTGPLYATQGATISYAGTATPNSYSIAMRLADFGSGYWVVPMGNPEIGTGNYEWSFTADYSQTIPSSRQDLLVVAIDENGSPGRQQKKPICVANLVTDNYNSCNAKATPPAAVISLAWEGAADLDLQVQTPDGTLVWAKHPTTVDGDGGAPTSSDGILDRDANSGCRGGISQENLVWQKEKPVGTYFIYANLFDSCRQPAVHFEVEVYTATENEDGTKTLTKHFERAGTLTDLQANGGAARGLFLTSFKFN